MPKDRDQLTPEEPADRDKVAPEATEAVSDDIAPEGASGAPLGHAAGGGDPAARDAVSGDEKDKYR